MQTRVVENAFGIMASRLGVLLTSINITDMVEAEYIVLVCCALHNFLRSEGNDISEIVNQEGPDREIVPGRWRGRKTLPYSNKPATNRQCSSKGQTDKRLTILLFRYWWSAFSMGQDIGLIESA
ncbi:unnamed protein product [Boreogadus saida]